MGSALAKGIIPVQTSLLQLNDECSCSLVIIALKSMVELMQQ